MVEATIDNKAISVTLDQNESYSPNTGSVQKVDILAGRDENIEINGQQIGDDTAIRAIVFPAVLTDSDTVEATSDDRTFGIHISGFEVN